MNDVTLNIIDSRTNWWTFAFCILALDICRGYQRPQGNYLQLVKGLLFIFINFIAVTFFTCLTQYSFMRLFLQHPYTHCHTYPMLYISCVVNQSVILLKKHIFSSSFCSLHAWNGGKGVEYGFISCSVSLHDVNRPIEYVLHSCNRILVSRPSHHSVFDHLQSALFLCNNKQSKARRWEALRMGLLQQQPHGYR